MAGGHGGGGGGGGEGSIFGGIIVIAVILLGFFGDILDTAINIALVVGAAAFLFWLMVKIFPVELEKFKNQKKEPCWFPNCPRKAVVPPGHEGQPVLCAKHSWEWKFCSVPGCLNLIPFSSRERLCESCKKPPQQS